jgi:hypothetical protein
MPHKPSRLLDEVGSIFVSNAFFFVLKRFAAAREQVWPNPGFQEQLVLFELCQYSPSPSCGIYTSWRTTVERRLKERQLITGSNLKMIP